MRRIYLPLLLAFSALPGCGDSLPPETDATKGRETLKVVLDSWQQGMTLAEFKSGNSGIVANDPDWAAGQKLMKYEVDPTDNRIGVDLLLSVTLTLAGDGAKPRQKTVNFVVAIGSQTVVLRKT